MVQILILLSVFFLVAATPMDEDYKKTRVVDEVTGHGYVAETHDVTTEDGYILTMHRIPYARHQVETSVDRPLVFVMHGIYVTSGRFLMRGPDFSIGYNLADAGFDVWFGNARGNGISRHHVSLNPDDSIERHKFFDFSWDDIGMYDLPAMIDYVLKYTGKQKLHYIGHSQGGTVFLVLASIRPEYNDKMASVHLLAGVGYQDYFPNRLMRIVAQFSDFLYITAQAIGLVEVTPTIMELIPLSEGSSKSDQLFNDLTHKAMCELKILRYTRNEYDDWEDTGFGRGGGAIKQVIHFAQNIRDRLFRRFHYGPQRNFLVYGSTEPPLYNLGLITSNVTMHYTISDDLLDERDVLAMAADMPNTFVRRVPRDSFLHDDFVAATDAKELVTDYIIDAIARAHNTETSNPDTTTSSPDSIDAATSASLSIIFRIYFMFCSIISFL